MTPDQTAYLQLAFRELEHFSLPGIGSLAKSLAGARIDPKTNIIYPPTERFEFTQGVETYTAHFVQLLMRRQRMPADEARQTVQELADKVKQKLDSAGTFVVEGIGEFSNSGGAYSFRLTAEDPTLQTFGLNPVSIHLEGKTDLKAEVEKAKEKKGQRKSKAESPDEKIQAVQQHSKRTKVLFIVLIGLLLGLGSMVFFFWDDLQKGIPQGQVYEDGTLIAEEEEADKPKKATETKQESKKEENPKEEEAPLESPKEEEKPETPAKKEEPKKEVAKVPTPTRTETARTTTPPAETGGTYRLILSEVYKDKAKAEQEAAFWKDYGGRLVPYGGGFTIQFFSGSRGAAQARQRQMEDSGDLYRGQSKIVQ